MFTILIIFIPIINRHGVRLHQFASINDFKANPHTQMIASQMQDRVRRMIETSPAVAQQAVMYRIQELWHEHVRRNLGTEHGSIWKKTRDNDNDNNRDNGNENNRRIIIMVTHYYDFRPQGVEVGGLGGYLNIDLPIDEQPLPQKLVICKRHQKNHLFESFCWVW